MMFSHTGRRKYSTVAVVVLAVGLPSLAALNLIACLCFWRRRRPIEEAKKQPCMDRTSKLRNFDTLSRFIGNLKTIRIQFYLSRPRVFSRSRGHGNGGLDDDRRLHPASRDRKFRREQQARRRRLRSGVQGTEGAIKHVPWNSSTDKCSVTNRVHLFGLFRAFSRTATR